MYQGVHLRIAHTRCNIPPDIQQSLSRPPSPPSTFLVISRFSTCPRVAEILAALGWDGEEEGPLLPVEGSRGWSDAANVPKDSWGLNARVRPTSQWFRPFCRRFSFCVVRYFAEEHQDSSTSLFGRVSKACRIRLSLPTAIESWLKEL